LQWHTAKTSISHYPENFLSLVSGVFRCDLSILQTYEVLNRLSQKEYSFLPQHPDSGAFYSVEMALCCA
jgi:hypothetical protein